jgi:hypothetical protein
MAFLQVTCPGCQTVIKALEEMAGKKGRCKKCNTPFRIPGVPAAGPADTADTAPRPSAALPTPAARVAPADVPEAVAIPEATAVPDDEPGPAAGGPAENPFAFADATPLPPAKKLRPPRPEPTPPPPEPTPAAVAPPAKKPAPPRPEPAPPPAPPPPPESSDPFAFTATPAAAKPAAKPAPAKPTPAKKADRAPRADKGGRDTPPAPVARPDDPFAFTATPAEPARPTAAAEPPPAAEEDPPAAEPPPAAEEDPPAEPAADGDPFAFSAAPAAPAAPAARKGDRAPRGGEEPPADRRDRRPPARKPAAGGGGGGLVKVVVGAAVFAAVAGGIVAGTLVFLNSKPAEQAAGEKKDEKKADAPSNEPAPADAGAAPLKEKETPKAGDKGGTGNAKAPRAKAAGGGGGGMLVLPPGKALAFPPRPAAAKVFQQPVTPPVVVAVPFAEARRFFPPAKRDADVGVAWRSNAGFQGTGEKITLSLFSPNTGNEVTKVEADGDGAPDPLCDLSVDGGVFVIGSRASGKVTVWDTRQKKKLLDGFDPYADKPEHKSAKLAAVYLTEPPGRVATVTTAGAVHVWEVATKAPAGEFVPPAAVPGKVAAGRGVAPAPNRQGLVVAAGGKVFQVATAGAVAGTPVEDLGGDVGRSLALAVAPSGRVVYAFETDADGKKERAVAFLRGGLKGPAQRWPADAAEPAAAAWCGEEVVALAAGNGAVAWFDAEHGYALMGLARPPEDKGLHAALDTHWSLVPAAGDPKRCVAVELRLPPDGLIDPVNPGARPAAAAFLVDAKGLSK